MKIALFNRTLLLLGTVLLTFSGCEKDDTVYPAEVSSGTYPVYSWDYTSPNHHTQLDIPELTSSIINTGSVMVYLSTDGGDTWTALPYTQYHSPYNYYMGYKVGVGKVQITWAYDTSLSQGKDPNEYYNTTVEFKVVIVSSAAKLANPDLDMNDYEQVEKSFDLEE